MARPCCRRSLRVRFCFGVLLAAGVSAVVCGRGKAQAPAAAASGDTKATAATLAEVKGIQDAFVARIHAEGFSCPIAVPPILVEDVPSLGQYDEKTNIIRTSDWSVLNPEERAFVVKLAGPGAKEADERVLFDVAAHHWIFVHELGHWWQACRKVSAEHHPYGVEYGADRISLAYWREVDPTVVTTMMPIFQQVLDTAPNPVPAGQDVEAYFDKHYEELGPSAAYPWFQSRMNVGAYEEKPAPSFKTVLAETK